MRRTAHWQPEDRKEDMADDVRDWVQRTSDPSAKLETLTAMSRKDLCDLMMAVHKADTPVAVLEPPTPTAD